ncbi:MAG: 50S ribosomal protein L25/general stress protein Ctc [Gallionella sp.]|nr:50S ribosomal protein L25/general stress protein Ctc [Gallionella sp.]MDP1941529.1 50S ribosomal protein L25/general stress protein Ctc [Gallionella sp.]
MATTFNATTRKTQGTGASRRLRKAGSIPGVVYGSGDAVMIEMNHNELYYKLRAESFHASVLTMNLDGKEEAVQLRAFVNHPFRQQVQHLDFQRVDLNKTIHIKVPLHFINEDIAPAVKLGGGKISHVMIDVDVTCLPADLPTFIEVDLGGLEMGHSVHLQDLKLPKGVELASHGTHTGEAVVATVQVPRGAVEAASAEAEAAK